MIFNATYVLARLPSLSTVCARYTSPNPPHPKSSIASNRSMPNRDRFPSGNSRPSRRYTVSAYTAWWALIFVMWLSLSIASIASSKRCGLVSINLGLRDANAAPQAIQAAETCHKCSWIAFGRDKRLARTIDCLVLLNLAIWSMSLTTATFLLEVATGSVVRLAFAPFSGQLVWLRSH